MPVVYAVRQCVRKIRKVNCVAEKEQAYPLVPFLLRGKGISVLGFYPELTFASDYGTVKK